MGVLVSLKILHFVLCRVDAAVSQTAVEVAVRVNEFAEWDGFFVVRFVTCDKEGVRDDEVVGADAVRGRGDLLRDLTFELEVGDCDRPNGFVDRCGANAK